MLSNSSQRRLIALARKAVENSYKHRIEKGVASKFIKFTESWGVKFSTYGRGTMFAIFNRQCAAHSIGKGPMAFGFFECNGYNCYITEIVQIVAHRISDACDCGSFINEYRNPKIAKRMGMTVKHLCKVLMKKIGFDFHDCHIFNIAFTRGDQIVCIDFGDE